MTTADVQKEVAQSTVARAREVLGVTDQELGQITGVGRRTVQRWAGRLSAPRPRPRERMEDLREVIHLAEKVFRTTDAAQRWFHTPVPAFRDRTPISMIKRGRTDEVIGALSGLLSGAHI